MDSNLIQPKIGLSSVNIKVVHFNCFMWRKHNSVPSWQSVYNVLMRKIGEKARYTYTGSKHKPHLHYQPIQPNQKYPRWLNSLWVEFEQRKPVPLQSKALKISSKNSAVIKSRVNTCWGISKICSIPHINTVHFRTAIVLYARVASPWYPTG